MSIRFVNAILFSILVFSVVLTPQSPAQAKEDLLPWTLRTHYSFSRDTMTLSLDEERAMWQLKVGDEQILADDLAFAIILADDTELRCHDLGLAKTTRSLHEEGPLGPYAKYEILFPVKDGMEVRYEMTLAKERPVSFSTLHVKNVGAAPIDIKTLRILEAPAGSIHSLSPGTLCIQRHGKITGGSPVVDTQGEAIAMQYHDPTSNASWLVGLSPRGQGRSTMRFDAFGEGWQGQVESQFQPPAQLQPGESLQSAEMIGVFGQQPIANLDMYYSWAYSTLERSLKATRPIEAWVTVSDQGSFNELLDMTEHWKSARIDHALIPLGWELPPGSQQGGDRFPRSIANAASELQKRKYKAGISFDPLAMKKGGGDWNGKSADGQIWANPAHALGKAAVQERALWLKKSGFVFLVPASSGIPEEVLQQFGLSRGQANRLALEAIGEALPDTSLYPPSSITKGIAGRDSWLSASASVARLAKYGVAVGPLQLDTTSMVELGKENLDALRLWPGPLEITGKAKNSDRKAIGETIGTKKLSGSPMDLESLVPLHWEAKAHREGSADEVIRFNKSAVTTP